MTHPQAAALLGCLLAGIPIGYYWKDFSFGRELHRQLALHLPTEEEIAARNAHDDSYVRTLGYVCGDFYAGSQVMRVQAELEAERIPYSPLCRGRAHPMTQEGRR